jgi:hypothetical protein
MQNKKPIPSEPESPMNTFGKNLIKFKLKIKKIAKKIMKGAIKFI